MAVSDDSVDLRSVTVNDWQDVDDAPMLTGDEKQAVVALFRDTDIDSAFILPDFKLNEDDHDVVRIADDDLVDIDASPGRLAAGDWEDYSAKAVRVVQYHRKNSPDADGSNWGCYIPKTTTVVLEAGGRLDDLDSPQAGLDQFTGDA